MEKENSDPEKYKAISTSADNLEGIKGIGNYNKKTPKGVKVKGLKILRDLSTGGDPATTQPPVSSNNVGAQGREIRLDKIHLVRPPDYDPAFDESDKLQGGRA